MIDGDPETRSSSGSGQAPQMSLQVDLGRPTRFSQLRLDIGSSIGDQLRSYEVQTSDDGSTWTRSPAVRAAQAR